MPGGPARRQLIGKWATGMSDFSDRTAIVTGAAGNLGRAVAAALSSRGAKLALFDVNSEALEAAYPGQGDARLKCAVDLLDKAALAASVAETAATLGGPDMLCAIAGGFDMGEAVHEMAQEKWDLMFDINVNTLFNSVRAVVPGMIARGGGRIVAVGSMAALHGSAAMSAYSASKAVVVRLTESMAGELRERNINVNCVLPSVIDTPENRAAMPDADPAKWVAAGDLANVVVFLCSDDARAIHGAALPVVGLS